MNGFDAAEAADEIADQSSSPNTKAGEFFVVDHRTLMGACALGLNPAIAYLVIARGAGSRRTSAWSVDAIERYTGISRPKAKAAVSTLIENHIITLERAGTRPMYGIVSVQEWETSKFSDDERIVLELIEEQKGVRIPHPHRLIAASLAGRGYLIPEKNDRYSKNGDAFFSKEKPHNVWLPNAIVDGAADERPPLALLRQMQDVRRLKLFIALYDVNNLPNDGGVSRALLYEKHELKKLSQRGPLTIWGFRRAGTKTATYSSLPDIFLTGRKDRKGRDLGWDDFWPALDGLDSCGLIKFIPHVFESSKPEAELMHAYATEPDTGEVWEHDVADAAHSAAWRCLEPFQQEWAEREGFFLLPLPSHISNVAVIGIGRLKYRPRTRMTAAWFAISKGRSEAWQTTYEAIIQGENTDTGGFGMQKVAT